MLSLSSMRWWIITVVLAAMMQGIHAITLLKPISTASSSGPFSNDVIVNIVEPAHSLTKTATPNHGDAGDTITYLLTYTNNGSATAFDVSLTDTVPGKMTADLALPAPALDIVQSPAGCAVGLDSSSSSGNNVNIIDDLRASWLYGHRNLYSNTKYNSIIWRSPCQYRRAHLFHFARTKRDNQQCHRFTNAWRQWNIHRRACLHAHNPCECYDQRRCAGQIHCRKFKWRYQWQ